MLKSLIGLLEKRRLVDQSFEAVCFSAEWYLGQYPDVAAAGIDAWRHFDTHGRDEGRFADEEHVLVWFDAAVFDSVKARFEDLKPALSSPDKAYFWWLIARRYAAASNWSAVIEVLLDWSTASRGALPKMPGVLLSDALIKNGDFETAEAQLQTLAIQGSDWPELIFLKGNLERLRKPDVARGQVHWLSFINELYARNRLMPIDFSATSVWAMNNLRCEQADVLQGPLVSVLMCARDAESSIGQAISSVLAQSWSNIELIIVDDASTDSTAQLADAFATKDGRIQVLRQDRPQGPYAARNRALEASNGDFITVHDADDWSHPQKIESQLHHLLRHLDLKGCFSSWVRVRSDLLFGIWELPSTWAGWVHRNTSSLLVRRDVFSSLGFWDQLTCNADSEFVDRIKAAWGPSVLAHVLPQVPLAFGRSSESGLTQQSETHLLTSLKGPRLEHMRAYTRWHQSAACPEDLFLPRRPAQRPYPVPQALLPVGE